MLPSEYTKEIKICKKLVLGYKVFCDKLHPLVNSSGWVYEHRHVVSVRENRWLLSEEQVHHIDRDKTNNSLDNLEILNRKEHQHKHCGFKKQYNCKVCNKLSHNENYCSTSCSFLDREKILINKDDLKEIVWSGPLSIICQELGISDVGLKKKCIKYGIETPPAGYWTLRNLGNTHQESIDKLIINKNYTPTAPKFTRDQLIKIVEGIQTGEFSMRKIANLFNCTHHPIMRIKDQLYAGKIKEIFTYYKAGEVPDNLI